MKSNADVSDAKCFKNSKALSFIYWSRFIFVVLFLTSMAFKKAKILSQNDAKKT